MHVWLEATANRDMTVEVDRAYPNETGGLLLGYWSEDGTGVVIESVIGPGPKAIHRRARFLPDHLYQTRLLAEAYEKSGRRTTYLGDWHSHPNGPQRLSEVDRNTLRRIARSVQQHSGSDHPAMMLLLSGPPWVTMISLGYVRDERWWRPTSLRIEHIANTRVYVVT